MHPHSDREHTSQRPAGHWLRIADRSKRREDAIRPNKHTVDHTVHHGIHSRRLEKAAGLVGLTGSAG